MTDIALQWLTERMGCDLVQDGGLVATDDGLTTAVLASLFTDRRARPDDVPPGDPADRRGWWGDAFPPVSAAGAAPASWRLGSRLWLLAREKQLASVVARAREYAEEALAWMIEDKVAASVDVAAEITAPGVLGLQVSIGRPDGTAVDYHFASVWRAQAGEAA